MKSGNRQKSQRLRIIGGDWRSRVLDFADGPELRPTPDRVRETLFNWLQFDIAGASCLDLFAGSGILGFEALSRGAAAVTALEKDSNAVKSIRRNCQLLNTSRMQIHQGDAMQWLQHSQAQAFSLVFIDPPYAAGLQQQCCQLLADRGWLQPGALIYLEAAEPLAGFALPQGWTLLKEKRAGEVHYGLLRASENQ